MKKVLVVKGQSAYNVLRYATDMICEGFQSCGYEIDVVDVKEEGAAEKFQACLEQRSEYAFYFSIQALFWNMEQMGIPQIQEIKRVGWIVDDPVYHSGRLLCSTGKDAHLLMVRDSHAKQVEQDYPQFDEVRTLYHGGFTGSGKADYTRKDIDVFFPGTYVSLDASEQKLRAMEGVLGTIAMRVKDRIVGENLACVWTDELRSFLKEISFEISEEEFRVLAREMEALDQYQRDYMRQRVVEVLLTAGITITVVGAGWNNYTGAGREHLKILSDEGMDITEIIKLMERSKIVLNNTNILDGLHERILTAMLNKAVCVTNEYSLLNTLFKEGQELVTFPLNHLEKLPVVVKELLENPVKAAEIAEAGYQAAVGRHTWQHRGEQIIHWIEQGEEFTY